LITGPLAAHARRGGCAQGTRGLPELLLSISRYLLKDLFGARHPWRSGRYVDNDVPDVLSFKSVVHPSPKVWMHYLEIRDPDQADDEIARWLRDAYDAAS
jgi:hypothetical protein